MKKILLSIIGIIASVSMFAQSPNAFSYQAVARASNGDLITEQAVSFRISILQGSTSGTSVYSETHSATTNKYGLVNLQIGNGTTSDDFTAINWANGPYFVKVEMDATGGTTYAEMGTSQLLSVPYAKYAEKASIQGDDGLKYNLKIDEYGNLYTEISDSICPSTVTDYNGNTYDVVQIMDQCWMAENLKVTHYSDGTPIPKVTGDTVWGNLGENDTAYCWYNNDSAANSEPYGALYTWAAAMKGSASSNSNPSGVQGICPDGWHMPSDEEWKELEMTLGMSQSSAGSTGYRGTNEGSKLADSAGLWQDGDLKNNAEFGTSGFSALPGGRRGGYDGSFSYAGDYGFWWSSTEGGASGAWYRGVDYGGAEVGRLSNNKSYGFSVRCVRD